MPKRQPGFMREAVKFAEENPGWLYPREIVDPLLQSGRVSSAGKNPRASLLSVIYKHYKDFRLEKREENGRIQFRAPATPSNNQAGRAPRASIGQIIIPFDLLSSETANVLNALVASGRYPSLPVAAVRLMDKGRGTKEIEDISYLYQLLTEAAGKV